LIASPSACRSMPAARAAALIVIPPRTCAIPSMRRLHRLTYRRHNHDNIHVRGYKEKGTTTTPFDMVVLNNLDRYQLAFDAIRRIPRLVDQMQKASDHYRTLMERHKLYVGEHGDDMPEVRYWRWNL
jgi:xylulose-5-phosphate/fructose-6-phosphate phosphoketolase